MKTNDYISRDWLISVITEGWMKFDTEADTNRFIHLIRDIAPEVSGYAKWEKHSTRKKVCSNCKMPAPYIKHTSRYCINGYMLMWESKFCPNCGAKMDLEEEKNNDLCKNEKTDRAY